MKKTFPQNKRNVKKVLKNVTKIFGKRLQTLNNKS